MPSPNRPDVRVSSPAVALFVISFGAGVLVTALLQSPVRVAVGAAVGLYCLFSVKVVQQWERVALMRLGRYRGLREPGPFWIIPVLDQLSTYVDQRIRVSTVTAETSLTHDTVPVNLDAIVFWVVWNAEKSVLEVADFSNAVTLSAQT